MRLTTSDCRPENPSILAAELRVRQVGAAARSASSRVPRSDEKLSLSVVGKSAALVREAQNLDVLRPNAVDHSERRVLDGMLAGSPKIIRRLADHRAGFQELQKRAILLIGIAPALGKFLMQCCLNRRKSGLASSKKFNLYGSGAAEKYVRFRLRQLVVCAKGFKPCGHLLFRDKDAFVRFGNRLTEHPSSRFGFVFHCLDRLLCQIGGAAIFAFRFGLSPSLSSGSRRIVKRGLAIVFIVQNWMVCLCQTLYAYLVICQKKDPSKFGERSVFGIVLEILELDPKLSRPVEM